MKFTSFVSVVGIAVGVGGLIVAQAVGRGFESEIRDRILAGTAHISIRSKDGAELPGAEELAEKVAALNGVTEIRRETFAAAMIYSEDRTRFENVILRVSEKDGVSAGTIVFGERLMEKFPDGSSGNFTVEIPGGARSIKLKSAGAFSIGIFEYDSSQVRLSRDDFTSLLGSDRFVPSSLAVSVKNIYSSRETAAVIQDSIGSGYEVIDWQEANRPLFSALTLERRGALLVIGLIVLIAALNIATTLSLLVAERRLDVAVLRTCGASTRTIIGIFLFEGIFLSILGTLLGVLIGLASCVAVNRSHLLEMPPEVYSVSKIDLHPIASEIILISFCGMAVSVLASILPSLGAALIKPVENLRRT